MRMIEPDYSIMAAGFNDLAATEKDLKVSDTINTYLPLNFAQAAENSGVKNIHLSCAQIFDGTGSKAKPDETHFSVMNFGCAKAAAERLIRSQTTESTTLRFGKVIGMSNFFRPSLFDVLRSIIKFGKRYYVADHKTYDYLSIISLIDAVYKLLQKPFPSDHRTYHVSGVSMDEIDMIRELAKFLNLDSNLIRQQINPLEENSSSSSTKRDYTLDSSNFEREFNWEPETLDKLKENLKKQMTPKLSSEVDFIFPRKSSSIEQTI